MGTWLEEIMAQFCNIYIVTPMSPVVSTFGPLVYVGETDNMPPGE